MHGVKDQLAFFDLLFRKFALFPLIPELAWRFEWQNRIVRVPCKYSVKQSQKSVVFFIRHDVVGSASVIRVTEKLEIFVPDLFGATHANQHDNNCDAYEDPTKFFRVEEIQLLCLVRESPQCLIDRSHNQTES